MACFRPCQRLAACGARTCTQGVLSEAWNQQLPVSMGQAKINTISSNTYIQCRRHGVINYVNKKGSVKDNNLSVICSFGFQDKTKNPPKTLTFNFNDKFKKEKDNKSFFRVTKAFSLS